MLALLQRVAKASVTVDNNIVGQIERGLMVLLCAEPADTQADAEKMVDRLFKIRVFPDAAGKMNLSLADCGGGLLLVPQFTLAADTRSGNRPSFSGAAPPELGRKLYEYMVTHARSVSANVHSGIFGADMKVSLVNDGPVTLWLKTGAGHR